MKIAALLALLICVACVVPAPSSGLPPPGQAAQPAAQPAAVAALYMRNIAPVSQDPNDATRPTCSNNLSKVCANLMRSCRCNSEGVCDDIACSDIPVARYCFCAWAERP
jgi:hypothetical protein